MAINTTAGLLDAIVLAVVGREETGTYGYKITQEVRTVLDLSESTLYPVLRRLQKDGCLTVHDGPGTCPDAASLSASTAGPMLRHGTGKARLCENAAPFRGLPVTAEPGAV